MRQWQDYDDLDDNRHRNKRHRPDDDPDDQSDSGDSDEDDDNDSGKSNGGTRKQGNGMRGNAKAQQSGSDQYAQRQPYDRGISSPSDGSSASDDEHTPAPKRVSDLLEGVSGNVQIHSDEEGFVQETVGFLSGWPVPAEDTYQDMVFPNQNLAGQWLARLEATTPCGARVRNSLGLPASIRSLASLVAEKTIEDTSWLVQSTMHEGRKMRTEDLQLEVEKLIIAHAKDT
jgi:hypothetical protein